MGRQWTEEETARGWLVAGQGERVAPPSLHPEADARLAAATTGAIRIDENSRDAEIARSIPATGGSAARYAAQIAEVNRHVEAILLGAPTTYSRPSTYGNASGHANASGHDLAGGPMGAEPLTFRTGQSPSTLAILDVNLPFASIKRADDRRFTARAMTARFNAEALVVAMHAGRTATVRSGENARDGLVVNVAVESIGMDLAMVWMDVEVVWRQALPAPAAKPSALAAGQVWERTMGATTQRRTLTRRDPDHAGGWFSEERPDVSTPGAALLTMDEWRFVGMREDAKPAALAAGQVWQIEWTIGRRSRITLRAPVGTKGNAWSSDEHPGGITSEGILLRDENCIRARYLGTREEVTAREREAHPLRTVTGPASPYRAAPARAPTVPFNQATGPFLDVISRGWFNVEREMGETDEALRTRCRRLGADGADFMAPAESDAAQRLRVAQKMSEVYNAANAAFDNAERWGWTLRPAEEIDARVSVKIADPLATLRAEIDRLIAADSGPFAHARAAALRCYGERHNGHDPTHATTYAVQRVMAALRNYEEQRGGAQTPRATAVEAAEYDVWPHVLATYERERARSDVYARPLPRRGSR